MKSNKEKIFIGLTVVIYALICLMIFLKGIVLTNDSDGYIGMSSVRSPVYPLLIKFFFFIGKGNYLVWLLCFQILWGALGVFVFSRFIYSFFKAAYWLVFLLSLGLLAPYFIFGSIANQVMTEAIAYPAFLFAIRHLTEAVFDKRMKPFVIFMLFSVLLILTRGQFLFLYAVTAVVIVYLFIYSKEKSKRIFRVLIIFISLVILTNLMERTYHYSLYRQFSKVSLTGLQLSAMGFYLSDSEDKNLFKDSLECVFFERVQQRTHYENNWNIHFDKKTVTNSGLGYYQQVYNKIIWKAVYPEAVKLVPESDASNDHTSWKFIHRLTKSVAYQLLKKHKAEFLEIYFKNVIYGIGYKHYSLLFVLSFVVFIISYCMKACKYSLIYMLMMFICFSNVLLVALVEPASEYRYLIYNDALYMSILILALNNWLKNKTGVNKSMFSDKNKSLESKNS